jgi:hypothetical protein
MSQRLHIGPTDNSVYDVVIASEADATEEHMAEWLYGSPHKIRIGDLALWDKVSPVIAELFPGIFPDDVWYFYIGERSIDHPTARELADWLVAGRKLPCSSS